jgi:hypothetical protein
VFIAEAEWNLPGRTSQKLHKGVTDFQAVGNRTDLAGLANKIFSAVSHF